MTVGGLGTQPQSWVSRMILIRCVAAGMPWLHLICQWTENKLSRTASLGHHELRELQSSLSLQEALPPCHYLPGLSQQKKHTGLAGPAWVGRGWGASSCCSQQPASQPDWAGHCYSIIKRNYFQKIFIKLCFMSVLGLQNSSCIFFFSIFHFFLPDQSQKME